MEDVTNKTIKRLRKDVDEAIGLFMSTLTMQSKIDDITKVADYMNTPGVEYKYVVRFTKALNEFHAKLLPIVNKINEKEGV